ncbi:MAG: helix-turn-helix transcriptional regulator [Cypionkella sp.]
MNLLSIEQVAERLGVSTMSVRRMIERGEFIDPIQISPRRVAFDAHEIAAWLALRPRGKMRQPAHLAPLGVSNPPQHQ